MKFEEWTVSTKLINGRRRYSINGKTYTPEGAAELIGMGRSTLAGATSRHPDTISLSSCINDYRWKIRNGYYIKSVVYRDTKGNRVCKTSSIANTKRRCRRVNSEAERARLNKIPSGTKFDKLLAGHTVADYDIATVRS